MTQVALKSKTFSKQAQRELVEFLPSAKKFKKLHIAGVGYVFFIYNDAKEKIGQCFRGDSSMKLNIL